MRGDQLLRFLAQRLLKLEAFALVQGVVEFAEGVAEFHADRDRLEALDEAISRSVAFG